MTVTILSDLEFEGDAARARNAASRGPVFITDRGEPAHVLLSIADYRRLSGHNRGIADLLAMPDGADVELEITPRVERPRRVDLS